ncbi:hypothetical protein SELMODRAFT_430325 [Selaginella moellendorffii]|uniref:Uncharacterized protein n=1 Tax=Selaginella moellendorffii TaxID=88036 RepID=D8T918_SELML|nr:hypothetical protein SELMODRAFT_430325 [Selaginella moellendorffii]
MIPEFIKKSGPHKVLINCVTPSWKLWKNIKFMLRSITASKLGCDPTDFSAAGKDVETWYGVVVAGRPGFQLDQLCSPKSAYKDKHLSLSWLDGEMQKVDTYIVRWARQYQVQDVARILMISFRRDPNHQKPVVKRINTCWCLNDEEQDLASMLIAPYSDANEISEVLS